MSYAGGHWDGEDSFGLVPLHVSAVRGHRAWSVGGSNPRAGEVVSSYRSNGKVEGDKEAAKAVASSWDKDWGSDTLNCTSLALGSCVRGSLVVGATSS